MQNIAAFEVGMQEIETQETVGNRKTSIPRGSYLLVVVGADPYIADGHLRLYIDDHHLMLGHEHGRRYE